MKNRAQKIIILKGILQGTHKVEDLQEPSVSISVRPAPLKPVITVNGKPGDLSKMEAILGKDGGYKIKVNIVKPL